MASEEEVWEALKTVVDPELGLNVVDLGLVYGVSVEDGRVYVAMTMTTPGCPLHESLTRMADMAIRFRVPGVDQVVVDLVWDPPWSPDRITREGRRLLGLA
jgi:metal-sulfur cluster biosynthetic enzyme